jgi:hypothetical protein
MNKTLSTPVYAPCAPVSARRWGKPVQVNRFGTFARNRQNGFVAVRNCFVKVSWRWTVNAALARFARLREPDFSQTKSGEERRR